MADLDNVLKGLECCKNGFVCGDDCPYRNVCFNGEEYAFTRLASDALELLKSQQEEIEQLQPKKGKWIEIESQTGVGAFGFNEVTVSAFRCSECRKKIDVSDGNFKYCPYCGAEMDK